MINILLSVRRPFSGKILSGEKGWELRKNAPLSAIGLTRPPQSWQYLTPEQAAILERRRNESRA